VGAFADLIQVVEDQLRRNITALQVGPVGVMLPNAGAAQIALELGGKRILGDDLYLGVLGEAPGGLMT